MKRASAQLIALLHKVYDSWNEPSDSADYVLRRDEFVFHMTDWLSDLEEIDRLYQNPESADAEQASQFIFGFLVHVTPHLRAAARALLGEEVTDPFAPPGSTPDSAVTEAKHRNGPTA
jgi:hypothetical protein